MTPPRVLAAAGASAGGNPGKDVSASLRGASGTPPPAGCPGMGGNGRPPLIRPCGATFPQGGRQGLLLAAAQGFAGRRGRRPLRLARERAATGACPSSGPAGPPSPKGEGKGCNPSRGVGASLRGASGTPPPTVCPGTGGSGSLPLIRPCGATFPQGGRQGLLLAAAGGRGGVGAPRPTDGDMETPAGFTRTPVPGPPHGRGRACPARGFTQAPVNGSVRREGS